MAVKNTPEERKVLSMINSLPIEDEIKQEWIEIIRNTGLNEDLVEVIKKKLGEEEDESKKTEHMRYLAEFSRIIKQWRLASQMKNFRQR